MAALWTALSMAGAVAVNAQAKPEKPVSFTGDIGAVNTAGNTSLTTLSVGDRLTVRSGKLLLTQTLALVYGKNEGVENANNQQLRGRADHAPPSPDLAKTDRTLTTGIQITY